VLEALKKLKDGNKVGDNKADDGGVDEDDVNKDEIDENKIDEDEISKIRDILTQKLAEKWIRGISKANMMVRKKIKPLYLIYKKKHAFTRKKYLILLMPTRENT